MRVTLILLLIASGLEAQAPVSFSDGAWEFRGSARVDSAGGREVLRLESGFAYRRDVRLEDGTIDVDVKVTRRRSFVYVGFRLQDDENHEEFYLRPHKSELPDAVQYAPVYHGQSAWQLYHGPGGTAAVAFEPGEWRRLRIVLKGRRAAVFLGDTTTPILRIPRLGHAPRPGYLLLRGFLPANTPGSGPIAEYANLRVRPGYVPFDFGPPAPEPGFLPGIIERWNVGASFTTGDSAHRVLPPGFLTRVGTVTALANGLVELNRQVPLPKDQVRGGARMETAVVAWVDLQAPRAGTYRLDLGFSDAVSVFLDGRPVLYANDSYLFEQRRDGLIGLDQATLFLPLRSGLNRLTVLVTDHFGGMGLMGRIEPSSGLGVRVDP
jgi:hypothetical protein